MSFQSSVHRRDDSSIPNSDPERQPLLHAFNPEASFQVHHDTLRFDLAAPHAQISQEAAAALSRAYERPPRWFGSLGDELYGYSLMALSSAAFAIMTLLVHLLGSPVVGYGVPTILVIWTRSLVQVVAATLYILIALDYKALLEHLSTRLVILLLLRGFVGSMGSVCVYTALALLPIGEAVALLFLNPIILLAGTRLFLNGSVSSVEGVASVVAFGGVLLIVQNTIATASTSPPPGTIPFFASALSGYPSVYIGFSFAFGAAALTAFAHVIVRQMDTRVHFMVSVFSFGATCAIASTAVLQGSLLDMVTAKSLVQRFLVVLFLLFQGLAGFAGQCALNKGVQYCRGIGVLVRNIDVPIAFLVGVLIFREIPPWQVLAGAILILTAVVGISWNQVMLV